MKDKFEKLLDTLEKLTQTLIIVDANIKSMTNIILDFGVRIRRLESGV
jgi:hypothetical protein